MGFGWLKRYMPRGLYGRAALILVLPVLGLMAIVAVVFIQRHFEEVTRQLTFGLALELRHLAQLVPEGEAGPYAEALRLAVTPAAAVPAQDRRPIYDISGITVKQVLREEVPGVLAVDLAASFREVRVWIDTGAGPIRVVADRRRASAANPHQFLVILFVFGAAMIAVAYVYLRNQLRPIARLAAAAEAFGKGRVAPYRPSGATEVRAAGRAFLDMRARIERHIEQRTMMLSGVSHDLRTPLTRLRLGLSMQPEGPEIAAMERDLEEMARLIDGFLDFARAEALDDPVAVVPADLARDVAAREGAALGALEGADRPVPLRALAVERALANLAANALRYGRRAEISVRRTEGELLFVVEDDGPGIPEDRREEAMRPFVRLDAARNQDRGSGVGLGLAIARDIARSHGGALRLGRSERLGGLRAELALPV